ncbi:hypothetical protein CVT24_004493 [Panaeolus cyanescens]|uniref:Peptidase A1 domain-containing protein n=1 Tax=Panaeolus cyanescens TaxID=181874 RepID=A0A409YBQ2_9AGAR|nr:hypothetical protein CVT24_004493 [Panaeolus cyanescens]
MLSLISIPLLLSIHVNALIAPFHVHVGRKPTQSRIQSRAPVPISNTGNAQYVSNVTIGAVDIPVLLDTGSSDLWVHFPDTVPPMSDTGKSVSLAYAVGRAEGNVRTADVTFGSTTVTNQAFLHVTNTSTFTGDIHAQGYDGLLGLGPNKGSVIRKKLKTDSANNMLQRIFESNRNSQNYITFLLDRKNDPSDPFKGQFTISELVPGFENVTSMPKLEVEKVNRLLAADQHWQALTDKDNGIIGPDGQAVKMKSIVPKAPKGQYVAVIDSGFTFSQVPRDVSDAIYGRVRGAYYDTENEWWLVPCGQYLNVSFNFAGINYPVHPLDLVDDNFLRTDPTGKKVCIGAFQPITTAFSLLGHYDMILGMSFLRNAYTLLDFGDWIKNSDNKEDAYMQMASIIDPVQARKDFVEVRLNGNDTIDSDPRWQLLPADQMQHSPISADEKKKRYQEMILSRWPYIFTGCLLFVLLTVGFCVWKCCCKKRRQRNKERKEAELAARMPTPGEIDDKNRQRGSFFNRHSKHDSYHALASPNQSSLELNAPYNSPYNNRSQAHLSVSSLPPSPAAFNTAPRQSYGYQAPGHQAPGHQV